MVVTESESVGSFLGHPIFKINSLKVLPCDHSLKNSPEEQVRSTPSSILYFVYLYEQQATMRIICTAFRRKRWRLTSLGC